jgi:FAD-linked oxidoreductase
MPALRGCWACNCRPGPPAPPRRRPAAPAAAVPVTSAPAAQTWSNWSAIASCRPRQWVTPATVEDLATVLKSAPAPLRCVGAGHSFTALVPTDGTLVSLDRITGLHSFDRVQGVATLAAGTRIAIATQLLDAAGLALMNQPDIDTQSLGGALATGTHGTGARFGAMHSDLVALKLVTAGGQTLSCSATERPELFAAAQVSLGCLGVLTEVTLRVRPRHMLRRRAWVARNEELFEQADALARDHQHFEMYFLPFTGYGAAIVHDEVASGAVNHPPAPDEEVLADLQKLRDWLGRWPGLRRWVAGKLVGRTPPEQAVDASWKLLASSRPTRFNETEGHVPRSNGLACVREVLQVLEQRNDVFFPMEFRYVRGDNAWLSPFQGRDSCSIAVHTLQGEPHDYLLSAIGPVLRRHGARPHWGKLHDYRPEELASHYPRWRDFLALRRELDPQNRLLSPYVQKLLGLDDKA